MRPIRWHIPIFLAPAVAIYSAVMIYPLFNTLRLALYTRVDQERVFAGLDNFRRLFLDPLWSDAFWNALGNNFWFFLVHMLVQNPIGIALAALLSHPRLRFAALYRTAIFVPTILSFVIVGFAWKLILSPIWGIAPSMLDFVGLKSLFAPWLGKQEYALTTLALISVWQFVGIPMMLIYAALLTIPEEIVEAAEVDGITGWAAFWKIKLPLILPSIGIISILTFVGNFNAFDLIYAAQGALAGPDFATDILGTFMYRTFFGFQLQLGDPHMGSAIATAMFAIILVGRQPVPVRHPDPDAAVPAVSVARRNPATAAGDARRADPLYADRAVPGGRDPDQQPEGAEGDLPRAAGAARCRELQPDRLPDRAEAGRLLRLLPELDDRHRGLAGGDPDLRRDGGLRAVGIPVSRQHADGPLSGAGDHDPDPHRHRGDPRDDGGDRAS